MVAGRPTAADYNQASGERHNVEGRWAALVEN
jgi:hypothetical protein